MDAIPSPAEQYRIIGHQMSHPLSNCCFAIHVTWWNRWMDYGKGESSCNPGYIDNIPLVKLGEHYMESMRLFSDIPGNLVFDNWKKMALADDFSTRKDMICVSIIVWNLFYSWYKGGPEIRLQVFKTPTMAADENGIPDLYPVILGYTVKEATGLSDEKGILISQKATTSELYNLLSDQLKIAQKSIYVTYYSNSAANYLQMMSSSQTLIEIDLDFDTTMVIEKEVELELGRRNKKGTEAREEELQLFPEGDFRDFEEESMQRAINESLGLIGTALTEGTKGSIDHQKYIVATNQQAWFIPGNKLTDKQASTPLTKYSEKLKANPKGDSELQAEFETYFLQAESSVKEKRIVFSRKKLKSISESLKLLIDGITTNGKGDITPALSPI